MAAAKRSTRKENALQTEKDGRLFAMAMFAALEEVDVDTMNASSEDEDGSTGTMLIFRGKGQDATLKQWMDELYARGTPEARNGFYVVLTDYIGSVIGGAVPSPASEYYADKEEDGKLEAWGTVNYRDRFGAQSALANGESAYAPRVLS